MKLLSIILILFCLNTSAQTRVIPVRTEQIGKITVLKMNGKYVQADGTFKWNGKPPYWYSVSTRKFTVQYNEVLIHRHITVWKTITE